MADNGDDFRLSQLDCDRLDMEARFDMCYEINEYRQLDWAEPDDSHLYREAPREDFADPGN